MSIGRVEQPRSFVIYLLYLSLRFLSTPVSVSLSVQIQMCKCYVAEGSIHFDGVTLLLWLTFSARDAFFTTNRRAIATIFVSPSVHLSVCLGWACIVIIR